ncbi:Alpha/Beta hydrolase protein [Gautieria morchelliformis]|nr:Alpha/Beta hydrolase protein [Gautieria morchelliformis]
MTSICLPVPLVLLLRRLFNAFSAFSISQNYLTSRWAASLEGQGAVPREDEKAALPDPQTEPVGQAVRTPNVGLAWDFLKRLRKALPSKDYNGVLHAAKQRDTVTGSRLRYSEALAAKPRSSEAHSPIHRLISNPQLFDPVRAPRYPIVLCHGLYGFDVRGPEAFPKLRMHYWSNVLHILRKKVGAEVIVTGVPGTGSIASRAERMDRFLRDNVKDRDINFLAHSMGGLDCRHLITHIKPREYNPLSLTCLSVPHRGSPFMDWCLANIGIGSPRPFPLPHSTTTTSHKSHVYGTSSASHSTYSKALPYSLREPILGRAPKSPDDARSASFTLSKLPSSFTSLILSLIDSPAYANLTTSFLRDIFNPSTPDKPDVKYFSVAARTTKMSIWHPLWLPKLIIDAAEEHEAYATQQDQDSPPHGYPHASEMTVSYSDMDPGRDRGPEQGNDGLVTVSSAKWGTFLGTMEGCDHWELRGARGLGADWDEGWGNIWREWVGKLRDGGKGNSDDMESLLGGKRRPIEKEDGKTAKHDWVTKNDLSSRFDLERFYVALSRTLYDEGL